MDKNLKKPAVIQWIYTDANKRGDVTLSQGFALGNGMVEAIGNGIQIIRHTLNDYYKKSAADIIHDLHLSFFLLERHEIKTDRSMPIEATEISLNGYLAQVQAYLEQKGLQA